MALFQIFNGNENDLDSIPFHEGYAYFCKNSGSFYIDTIVNGNNKRVPISSHGLLDDEGNFTDYDEFLQTGDADDIKDAVKTNTFTKTLASNAWQLDASSQQQKQTISILGLRCGSGATPPEIICTSGNTEYDKIERAVATPAIDASSNGQIDFYIRAGYTVPTTDIGLLIVDFG